MISRKMAWPFLGSFSTWLRGQARQRMEEVTRKQGTVWSRTEGLMSISHSGSPQWGSQGRNTEQHARRCSNTCKYFVALLRGEGQAESRRLSVMFLSRSSCSWPWGLSLVETDQVNDGEGVSTSSCTRLASGCEGMCARCRTWTVTTWEITRCNKQQKGS